MIPAARILALGAAFLISTACSTSLPDRIEVSYADQFTYVESPATDRNILLTPSLPVGSLMLNNRFYISGRREPHPGFRQIEQFEGEFEMPITNAPSLNAIVPNPRGSPVVFQPSTGSIGTTTLHVYAWTPDVVPIGFVFYDPLDSNVPWSLGRLTIITNGVQWSN